MLVLPDRWMPRQPRTLPRSPTFRITATQRPWILPRLIDPPAPGHRPDDPLVRRYWTALIGPRRSADLLRITAAARTCRPLRRPVHLGELIGDGLAHHRDGIVMVQRDIHPPRRPSPQTAATGASAGVPGADLNLTSDAGGDEVAHPDPMHQRHNRTRGAHQGHQGEPSRLEQ